MKNNYLKPFNHFQIFLLFALFLSSVVTNAQIYPKTVDSPGVFQGTGQFVYTILGVDQNIKYKIYANNLDHPIDSMSNSLGPFPNLGFNTPGSLLKEGLNTLTVTGSVGGQIFKVPNNIVSINGFLTEGYNMDYRASVATPGLGVNSVIFGLLWDDNYLYVGVKVVDPTPHAAPLNNPNGPNDDNFDGIELLIDPLNFKSGYSATTTCGSCLLVKQLRTSFISPPNSFDVLPAGRDITGIKTNSNIVPLGSGYIGTTPTTPISGTGYTVEFAIPWSNFYGQATVPGVGASFGFELVCNNNVTGASRTNQQFWSHVDLSNQVTSSYFTPLSLSGMLTTTSSNLITGKEVVVNIFTVMGVGFPVLPSIILDGTVPGFISIEGTMADIRSFTISGLNLTANLNLTASGDFQISTLSGSEFSSSLSITSASNSILGLPVYVRYNSTVAGMQNGSITISTDGALSQTINLTASLVANTIAGPNTFAGIVTITSALQTSNGLVFTTSSPLLSWHPVQNTISYCLEISTDAAFNTIVYSVCGITDTFLLIPQGKLSGSRIESQSYYWRVAVVFSSGQANWSEARTFAIGTVTNTIATEDPDLIRIFPNPNAGNFIIEVPRPCKLEIINSLGSTIRETYLINTLNTSIGVKGLYIFKFSSDNYVIHKKVIIE